MSKSLYALTAAMFIVGPGSAIAADNATLGANRDVVNVQGAATISTFMSQGAQTCDAQGKNCHSIFGADDTPDYTSLQTAGQSLTGVSAFSFLDGEGSQDGGSSQSIAAQLGTLALACGDDKVHKVAGIAVKVTKCAVSANGDAQLTVQVCSAPTRGNPVTSPENAVPCSSDASASNFTAPTGYVCLRPACDSEPVGSLNGWNSPQDISFKSSLPSGASTDTQAKNGLGLVFYPPLTGGALASFTADSDNMTAVKVVQTFVNNETKATAVGLKIAYRHKTQVTKEMMTQGAGAVPNPGQHTAMWDTVDKLQGNASIPQYQQKYGAQGRECLQQITTGLAGDGTVSVCDPDYNRDGIQPLAKTVQIAADGQTCGTTPQCLKEVVNTTTWQESCQAEVPLALRTCTTVQDHTIHNMVYTRTRSEEICHEKRLSAEYSCDTQATANCTAASIALSAYSGVRFSHIVTSSGDILLAESGRYTVDADTFSYSIGYRSSATLADNIAKFSISGDAGSGWSTYYNFDTVKEYILSAKIINMSASDATAIYINNRYIGGRNGNCGGQCAPSNSTLPLEIKDYLVTGQNVMRVWTGNRGKSFGSSVDIQFESEKIDCTYNLVATNSCAVYEAAR